MNILQKESCITIAGINNQFSELSSPNDKLYIKLQSKKNEIASKKSDMFAATNPEVWAAEIEELSKELAEIEQQYKIRQFGVYDNSFEWRFAFPEVLNDKGEFEGFDLVIGNPPYGVSIKDDYREVIVNLLKKVPDFEIYYFFINLANKILKPNGINSYLIPNTILFNVFARKYRENLFNDWQLDEILDCTGFNIFEGSATVRNIITLFINKESNDIVYYRPTNGITSFEELISGELSQTTKDILLANNRNWALVFKLDSTVRGVVSKIKQNQILSDSFDVSQGYIPYRKSDLTKLYGEQKAESIVENREWHSDRKINNEYKQEIWGTNLSKYGYTKPSSYVWYGKHLAGYIDLKYFNQKRLLIREITNPTIIACIVKEELVNDPQIISIIPESKNADIRFLWAVMNSKLATFYHFNSSPKATKGEFPKILVDDIKIFPIPNISKPDMNEIIKIIDKVLSGNLLGKDTSDLERELDKMIYDIYSLSSEEIEIIERS